VKKLPIFTSYQSYIIDIMRSALIYLTAKELKIR